MVDLKIEKEKYKLSKTLIETVENEYNESRYLKLLKKKGATVKFKGNLIRKPYKTKYTLKEALLKGLSNFNTLTFTDEELAYLAYLLEKYRAATTKEGWNGYINKKYIDGNNKVRFHVSDFIRFLKKHGFDYESSHMREFTEKKVAKIAAKRKELGLPV